MKKPIFVITYNEGKEWCDYYNDHTYSKIFNDPDYQIIFLDNGNQDIIKEWAEKTNSIHFVTENNIGTTGGYNWFIKVGAMLKSPRIAVMQADVQIHNSVCLTYLFNHPTKRNYHHDEFVYWPNQPRKYWNLNLDWDVGQFFSLDPTFFLENNYLCDENYTVTHFESTDLFCRMVSDDNLYPARVVNLLRFFPDKSPNKDVLENYDNELYTIKSFTNIEGLHDRWFDYNFDYFRKKWMRDLPLKLDDAKSLWGRLYIGPAWVDSEKKEDFAQLLMHKMNLDVHRNINIGQLPYPVEWEINRFYKEKILTNIIKTSDYQ